MTRLTLIASFLLAACGGASSAPSGASTAPASTQVQPSQADDPSCPVAVPGTSVTVEDTPTGAAMVFVTTGDVAELRKRVATMAQMHNDHHSQMGPLPTGNESAADPHAGHGGGHGGHSGHGAKGGSDPHAAHGGGGQGGQGGGDHTGHASGGHGAHGGGEHAGHAGGMIGVHARASAEDIDGGARLVLVVTPADLGKVHDELRKHAQHLANGTCDMEPPK
jgi:hypothetical protein